MDSVVFLPRTLSVTMQYVRPKYISTKFYGNSTFMVIVWILVKNSGVHLDCLWQKQGTKKFAMSTKWMEEIFSSMFLENKYVQFCAQTFYKNIFPVFVTDIGCFYHWSYHALLQSHTILLQKQEICSHKMSGHNLDIFFLSKSLKMFSLRTQEKHWRKYILPPFGRHCWFLVPCFLFIKQSRWTPLSFTKIHGIAIKVKFP